jgi:hypothetical protein
LLIFSPVFIYGLLNNLLPYVIPKLLVLKIKDKQFHSSVKFVWALFVLPILYLAQAGIFWAITDNFLWAVLYLISIGVFGLLAQLYIEWLALIRRDLWLYRIKKGKPKVYRKIKSLHEDILHYLDRIHAPEIEHE